MLDKPAPDDTGPIWQRSADRFCLAAVAVALLGALVYSIACRGPWYDEFYTFYVTDPGFAWREAFSQHWLPDNHPPLYYVLVRAVRGLWSDIEALRLINVVFGAIAFACAGFCVRGDRKAASLAIVLFLFLASQRATLLYGAELRSYFLTLCSTSLLVLALTAIYFDRQPGGFWRRSTLALSIFVSFNTHIVATLVSGAILLPFVVVFALQRNFGALRAILIPAVLSGLVFVAVTAIQLPLWEANTRSFWIPAGFTAGWTAIQVTAQRALEGNPVILVLAAIGWALSVVQAIRHRLRSPELEVCAILGVGALLALGLLLGIHGWRPIIVEKYLTCLIPVLGMTLAIGMGQLFKQVPAKLCALLMTLAAVASLVAINAHRLETVRAKSWTGTAEAIGSQVARCPDTVVHIDPYWNSDIVDTPPRDNIATVAFAYRVMARRHGFAVEPVDSRRISNTCPTLFWAEHDTRRRFATADIVAHLRDKGFDVSNIAQVRLGDGWIASTGPIDGERHINLRRGSGR